MAEHDMADVGTRHLGACQAVAHDLRRQIGRGKVLQAAAKGSNGGAHGTDDNDITAHIKLLY